jgi:hypothetical protein
MSAVLPTALLPIAGLLALVIVWPRLSEQRSNGRHRQWSSGRSSAGEVRCPSHAPDRAGAPRSVAVGRCHQWMLR